MKTTTVEIFPHLLSFHELILYKIKKFVFFCGFDPQYSVQNEKKKVDLRLYKGVPGE